MGNSAQQDRVLRLLLNEPEIGSLGAELLFLIETIFQTQATVYTVLIILS